MFSAWRGTDVVEISNGSSTRASSSTVGPDLAGRHPPGEIDARIVMASLETHSSRHRAERRRRDLPIGPRCSQSLSAGSAPRCESCTSAFERGFWDVDGYTALLDNATLANPSKSYAGSWARKRPTSMKAYFDASRAFTSRSKVPRCRDDVLVSWRTTLPGEADHGPTRRAAVAGSRLYGPRLQGRRIVHTWSYWDTRMVAAGGNARD